MYASTLQLLRFHFSFFLMPVYWFGLSQVKEVNTGHAIAVFVILHLLVYPSSNGYNSYMDRDSGPIGGIANPKMPTRQLFYVSIAMDVAAILAAAVISVHLALGILCYILASRAYSYRGIRLKQYPVIGYLVVAFFQGAVTFWLVVHSCSDPLTTNISLLGMLAASLLVGGFYPLTQIYQHRQDAEDGVKTLSLLLGYRGTFVFTAIIYGCAMATLAMYFQSTRHWNHFLLLQIFIAPVLVYFVYWFCKVYRDESSANFNNTMRMNVLASVCTNAAFITIFLISRS